MCTEGLAVATEAQNVNIYIREVGILKISYVGLYLPNNTFGNGLICFETTDSIYSADRRMCFLNK